MLSRDFCYWLQGFFEIQGGANGWDPGEGLRPDQVEMIRKHLSMVFKHEIDPSMGSPEHQEVLRKLHEKVEKQEERVTQALRRPLDSNPKIMC